MTEFQYQLMGGEDIGSGMVEELMMLKNRNAPPGSPTPKKLPADSSNVVVAPEGPSMSKCKAGEKVKQVTTNGPCWTVKTKEAQAAMNRWIWMLSWENRQPSRR